jgi:spermidine synthase
MNLRFSNLFVQIALILSAASALIYEIVVTDTLFFYFIESTYSLATVLSVFLFGLGVGSLSIYILLPKIKNKKFLFGFLQIFIAFYAFLVLFNLTEIIGRISTLGTFLVSFILLLVPTIFLGAIFPLAGSILKEPKKDNLGLIYSVDLLGAIAGSLIAGFLLIPLYGHKATIIFAGGLNLISAGFIFPKKHKLLPLLFFILLFILFINLGNFVIGEQKEYDFYSDSPYGVVKIKEGTLYIDEKSQCSSNYGQDASERLMADYALSNLEKEKNIDVLNIGLGCGLTIERALNYDVQIDIVEINPKVVLANKLISNVLKEKRVNLIIDDGLDFLRKKDKKYDVILIDVQNPLAISSSNLYTVEAFNIVKESLNGNGIFALWNYEGNNQKYLDVIYYSMKEDFNFVYQYPGVFVASNQKLSGKEYSPVGEYIVNTIDKKIIPDHYF